MRLAAKRDANEPAIIAALEAAGYAVQRLSEPGVPDLLVRMRKVCGPKCSECRNAHWLLEVKMPGAKLTPEQVKWHASWPGRVAIVHNKQEALEAVR